MNTNKLIHTETQFSINFFGIVPERTENWAIILYLTRIIAFKRLHLFSCNEHIVIKKLSPSWISLILSIFRLMQCSHQKAVSFRVFYDSLNCVSKYKQLLTKLPEQCKPENFVFAKAFMFKLSNFRPLHVFIFCGDWRSTLS